MSNVEETEKVDWVLDDNQSSDDEFLNDTAPIIVRNIPKYDEADNLEDSLQKKFDDTLAKAKNKKIEDLLKKSIIVPGFEQLHAVPPPVSTRRTLRRLRKKEQGSCKGPGWYNLPAQEMTDEIKNDLELLKMRSVLDPKRFYKHNDITHTPKYFQVGTVIENSADFYSGRIPKSQRKKTLVEELMADAAAAAYQKKKYKGIIDNKRRIKPKRGMNMKKSKQS